MIKSLWAWFRFIWINLSCHFGRHLPGEYCGEIAILDIDRATHRIEYGNRKKCPNCGKPTSIDYS